MRIIGYFVGFCLVVALGVAIFVFAAWRPAIALIEPPSAENFAPDLVRHGAELAAIGNCDVCHTVPGGKPFAGGRAVPTPFGTIFSTNITPDRDTGIGRWSEAAFQRAMRQGVRRDGQYLYPAFPYDHFTLVSDDDNRADSPSRAIRTPPPIARSPARSKSSATPAAPAWCARWPRSMPARWSIPTASPIRSRAASCNP